MLHLLSVQAPVIGRVAFKRADNEKYPREVARAQVGGQRRVLQRRNRRRFRRVAVRSDVAEFQQGLPPMGQALLPEERESELMFNLINSLF